MNREKQKGNVLVASLLLMMTMNLMGAGLIYKSVSESNSATFKTVEATTLQVTDSCTNDVVVFFEGETATPTSIDDFGSDDINYMLQGEGSYVQNKLQGYRYDCTVTFMTTKTVDSGSSVGENISSTGSEYGGTGGTTIKDYYKIVSTGQGPKNSTKVINTIISVEY